jgi:hypothetical protein
MSNSGSSIIFFSIVAVAVLSFCADAASLPERGPQDVSASAKAMMIIDVIRFI